MNKLYTEEQLKEFFKEHYFITEEDLKNFTPIQLPGGDEIIETAFRYNESELKLDYINSSPYYNFIDGAKWMIYKIKGGQGDNYSSNS